MTLLTFLGGAITIGFLLAALFFARFWKKVGDGLFLAFAGAFGLLGLGQALLSLGDIGSEERSWIFLLRLLAFSLIIVAIVRKNRPAI
ncbi:hypothetical protein E2493_17085 [Sphingomonas parva]|uniref:Uncharacterized protein n=1 Tax=Sphingomonas parva TaxID=2555898 RepID=A0A4Y8ZNP0_9SPHN|nr:DUF5985 family protein [Sphingomonas parva]TFI57067.1 hypothetical protein E2493_17085 [Sphingomonas parva]